MKEVHNSDKSSTLTPATAKAMMTIRQAMMTMTLPDKLMSGSYSTLHSRMDYQLCGACPGSGCALAQCSPSDDEYFDENIPLVTYAKADSSFVIVDDIPLLAYSLHTRQQLADSSYLFLPLSSGETNAGSS